MALPANDSLKSLSDKEIETVVEVLKKDLPDTYHILCFVMNLIDYKKKMPQLVMGVYAPGGDFSDSTVVTCLDAANMMSGTFYSSSDEGCRRLKSALTTSKLFHRDRSMVVLISALHDRVHQAVGTDWLDLPVDCITPCNLYSISCEDALLLNTVCPEDVELRSLQGGDADLIDSLWPHRTDETVELIRQVISISPCVGLYNRSDNQLLSWILRWFYGGLGILQTVESAKRKGYAQLVIAELSKRLAVENWPIHATVLVENHASNTLFTKMGFKNEFLCHYIEYLPAPSK